MRFVYIHTHTHTQAARVTYMCERLKDSGPEIRARPLQYRHTPQLDLDSVVSFLGAVDIKVCIGYHGNERVSGSTISTQPSYVNSEHCCPFHMMFQSTFKFFYNIGYFSIHVLS